MKRDIHLSDGRIVLRPPVLADAEAICAAVRESIADVSPWAPWCHPAYSIDDTRDWLATLPDAWARGTDYDFAVLDRRDGALLGGFALNQFNTVNRFANLGYWTRTSRTGQGTAPAAARLVARFGFESLGLGRIEIVAAVGNTASQRVAEKAGATREGVVRRRQVVRDRVYDSVLFSLLAEEVATGKGD